LESCEAGMADSCAATYELTSTTTSATSKLFVYRVRLCESIRFKLLFLLIATLGAAFWLTL